MLLRKAHKLAAGCQLGRKVLSYLLHIILNILEKIISKMRENMCFPLILGKDREPHGYKLNFNISAHMSTSQLSPRSSKSLFQGLLCTLNKSEPFFNLPNQSCRSARGALHLSMSCTLLTWENCLPNPRLPQHPYVTAHHLRSTGDRDFPSEHKNLSKGTSLLFMLQMTKNLSSPTAKAQIFLHSFL